MKLKWHKIIYISLIVVTILNSHSVFAQEKYTELYRQQFHFSPEKNWMNDVNGLVYFDGEYHMFYQYNPFGIDWGHMSWGHAVSKDMLHWEHLPLALAEENDVMIFSGSAVIDVNNTSGFGTSSVPPMVAIYTGRRNTDNRQYQCIAYSNDKGRTWTKYDKNPVIDIESDNFRDPYVFWFDKTKQWIMVVSMPVERKVRFYSSPNLREWTLVSEFGPRGAVTGVWECPTMFPLKADNTGEIKWILQVDVSDRSAAGSCGGQYFVGAFDGTKFTLDEEAYIAATDEEKEFLKTRVADTALWVDYGRDHYAVIAWSGIPESDGRTIWCAWMSNFAYGGAIPTTPWRGSATLPRELSLRKAGNTYRLFQEPIREIKTLRDKHFSFNNISAGELNSKISENNISGNLLELEVEADVSGSGFTLELLKGNNQQTCISYDKEKQLLIFDRSKSGRIDFSEEFKKTFEAPLKPIKNIVKLHILVDHSSVEVFANDGEKVMTGFVFPDNKENKINLSGFNPGMQIKSFNVWTLKSTWSSVNMDNTVKKN